MNKTIFQDVVVQNICNYYERKQRPSTATMALWYKRIERVPDDAAPWIATRICETQEAFPKNLPNNVLELYREWRTSNPEKQFNDGHICKAYYCNGSGYIFASKGIYRFTFRCPVCNQAPEAGIPYFTRKDHTDGYIPIETPKLKAPRADLHRMIDNIGTPINDGVPF